MKRNSLSVCADVAQAAQLLRRFVAGWQLPHHARRPRIHGPHSVRSFALIGFHSLGYLTLVADQTPQSWLPADAPPSQRWSVGEVRPSAETASRDLEADYSAWQAKAKRHLRVQDFVVLGIACSILSGSGILACASFTGHEAVIPQSAREMRVHHDWLVPTIGGFPWLERPPLPHWIIVGVTSICGSSDAEWVSRLPAALAALGIVWMAASMAAGWYGRVTGLLTGLILATMWEFFQFATDPEADIFLCFIVTAALAAFVRAEFGRRGPEADEVPDTFLGKRPLSVLAFFVLLGATHLAKGLVFGTLMVLVPVGSYLVLQGRLGLLRRYVWLWGWLAFLVLWLVWPVAVYQRYPDVWELWISDYVGRLNHGYVAEPAWYYAMTLPWVVLPWTIPALAGIGLTLARAVRVSASPERFLWCWGILVPLFFSIPDGKHHHYLLQCLVPWAVLAALGTVRLWQSMAGWPGWLRSPLLGAVVLTLLLEPALWVFRDVIPGPHWLVPAVMLAWPVIAFGLCWAPAQRNGVRAAGTAFALLLALYSGGQFYRACYLDSYRDENAFLQEVRRRLPADQPLYARMDRFAVLETFRLLFYGPPATVLLPNVTFLRDEQIKQPDVYFLGMLGDREVLSDYGAWEVVLESPSNRHLVTPDRRRVLFHVRFREDLVRRPAPRVSVMQAVSRAEGPYLE
jgi:4-amino-4-deoxy-L-arabinose transferase-like glycosyltransferase